MANKRAKKAAAKPARKKPKEKTWAEEREEKKQTERQRRFVREYCLTGNASLSYRRAYQTDNVHMSNVESAKLMKNEHILAEIEEWRKEQAFKFEVTAEKLLQELASIAFFDLRHVMNESAHGVSLKHWEDIPPHVSRAIQQVSESESQLGTSRSVRGYDKVRAIELLRKILKEGSGADAGSQSREDARRAVLERISGHISKPKE